MPNITCRMKLGSAEDPIMVSLSQARAPLGMTKLIQRKAEGGFDLSQQFSYLQIADCTFLRMVSMPYLPCGIARYDPR